jgi:hypothetical protein
MYVDSFGEFINEKLVYDNGKKKSFKTKNPDVVNKQVGYLEIVNVPGIGEFVAKFDSGNGSICSITCDEHEVKGGRVLWKIGDKVMDSKYIGKSVVYNKDEVRVRIELDVEFDGVLYEKVPFTLADRSKNYAKMLLNRTFINTCHAVIDTSKCFIRTKKPKGFSVNNKTKHSGIEFEK